MSLLFMLVFCCTLYRVKAEPNYGPFVMSFPNMTTCKGPKSHDCSVNTLLLYRDDNNITRLNMTFHVHKDCHLLQIRSQAFAMQLSGDNKLFTYNVQKPCQHFFFGPFLQTMYNITEKCVIRKGTYNIDIDVLQIAHVFYGTTFFYGSYNFKTTAISSKENFSCTNNFVVFEKT